MECTDLMLDDWVIDTYTGKPMRVPCVNIRVGKGLEPIPLTPEILDKNFGEDRNGGYFEGDDFYELFIIEVNDGTWIIKHDNIEFSNIPRQQVMVSYVHELQHALKLCGIDKEIMV